MMRFPTLHSLLIFVLPFALGVSLIGCGAESLEFYDVPGDIASPGVTPGGVQDINYARALVAEGTVPPADAMTVEGLLSEHDLPVDGEPCTDLMCLRPAIAVVPDLETGESAYWLQLGMVSGLRDFVRPPLDLTIVVDRSSSMSVDMRETNEAVINMLNQLRSDDRVSILAFNQTIETVFDHGPVTDLDTLAAEVRRINATGSWDIQPALARAVEVQRGAGNSPDRLRRIVVLSCGYPDSSENGPFATLARQAAAERIGFTFVGILLGFDGSLGELLGHTRGGSYHYVSDLASTESLFEEDFDYMMTPIAYDLSIGLELTPGLMVDRAFGIPGDAEGEASARLEVTSAFVSRRRGAVLVRLAPTEEVSKDLGRVTLGYEPETAFGFTAPHDAAMELTLPESVADVHWGSASIRKAVALANAADRMRTACAAFHEGNMSTAREIMESVVEYLRAEATALDDADLHTEAEFAERLASLM